MSHRVIASCAFLFALALAGCAAPRPFELTVDDAPVENISFFRASLFGSDQAQIEIRVTDPGPPGVADAGVSFVFRVDLSLEGARQGLSLDATGESSMRTEAARSVQPIDRLFTADEGSNPNVLGVFAWTECFCGTPGTFVQHVDAHIEIREVSVFEIRFVVFLDVDGQVPGQIGTQHLELQGTFTAQRPMV